MKLEASEVFFREASTIGLDAGSRVVQVHGTDATGNAVFSLQIPRSHLQEFLIETPCCKVVLEDRAGVHHLANQIAQLGHDPHLVAAEQVNAIKTVKFNAGDICTHAEAICAAGVASGIGQAILPTSDDHLAAGNARRASNLLERQRTQIEREIRALTAEHGLFAPSGPAWTAVLIDMIEDPAKTIDLPNAALKVLIIMVDMLDAFDRHIARLESQIARSVPQSG